jgi:hypothetical protein
MISSSMQLLVRPLVGMTLLACFAQGAQGQTAPPGEGPALGTDRIRQTDITSGLLDLDDIRLAGRTVFATPFNMLDGYGDGPMDPGAPLSPGGRPTLGGNGVSLRVNGLDSQSCLECHGMLSTASIPASFAVGGFGGTNTNVFFQPTLIDVTDTLGAGMATFDGRYINPPFVFGAGGVELLAKEMTRTLQRLRGKAFSQPGTSVPLVVKGVDFGSIRYDAVAGSFDTSGVQGIEPDLVVRPFGRKGDNATVREFSKNAMQFHFGIQPVEVVGPTVDDDGDGVTDELFIGELSALHVFGTNLEPPEQDTLTSQAAQGAQVFASARCSSCHVPFLDTSRTVLTYSYPETHTSPDAGVYFAVDLSDQPADFASNPTGGIRVPLFADLKRHDMGPGLAEAHGSPLDRFFTTARLWGVADTAPYLHDGRALSLTDAILMHGGEAQASRDAFANLGTDDTLALLAFLRTLRTPDEPGADLD